MAGAGVGPLPQDSEQTSDGRLGISELLLHILCHAGTAALLLLTMMKTALPMIKATRMTIPHWVMVGTFAAKSLASRSRTRLSWTPV